MKFIFPFTFAVIAGSLATAGCLGATAQDLQGTERSFKLLDSAYTHLDGGAARALVREAACEESGILARNKIDAGGSFQCN